MRALTLAAAQTCENALRPRCHCRCRGALHGAKRGASESEAARLGFDPGEAPPREWFEGLPAEDPHHLPNADERRAKKTRAAKKARLRKAFNKLEKELRRWQAFTGGAELSPYAVSKLATMRAELANL